jgi:hypothetical protein
MELKTDSGGQVVLATADVAHGWRKLTNTFGFCEEARLEFPSELVLRVQASIRAWPNIFGSRLMSYPQNVFGLLKATWGKFELREGELRMTIEVPVIRGELLPRSGLPGIYQPPVEVDRRDRIGFWFSLLIVLAQKTHGNYPDIVEWDTQFAMGGRPGSSRRH